MATLPGSRVRNNGVLGVITDNPLTVGAITMNSPDLADLDTITSNHAIITLDPFKQHGDPEIVMVTTHTPASTVATITRGMYGTAPRQHPQGTLWVHAAVDEDFIEIVTSSTRPNDPYEGQFIYETDTNNVLVFDGTSWTEFGGGGGSAITLAYAEVTANQTGITAADTPLNGLSVTVTIPAGRRIRITGHTIFQQQTSTGSVRLKIFEGGSEIQRIGQFDPAAANVVGVMEGSLVLTPTAGAHTYFLTLATTAGTVNSVASATFPAFILVEDISGDPNPVDPESVPVGQLAYSEKIANQTGTTGVTDITDCSVNISVSSGRQIRIHGHLGVGSTVASDVLRIRIQEDGTTLQIRDVVPDVVSGTSGNIEIDVFTVESPSAGAHTYKLTIERLSGSGTWVVAGNVTFPTFILVEDITPTPSPSPGAPSSTLAYAEKLSNQTGTTGITDITDLTATVTVPSGRRIKIQGHLGVGSTVVGDILRIRIQEGGSTLQIRDIFIDVVSGTTGNLEIDVVTVETPTAGMHTYKLTIERLSGSGTWIVAGNATFPAFILVEDITGAVFPAGSEVTAGMIASEPWLPYTPSNTNITIGNGTEVAFYQKIGRTVFVRYSLTWGGTTAFTGNAQIGLPIPAASQFANGMHGAAYVLDSGSIERPCVTRLVSGSTTQVLVIHGTTGNGVVNATQPMTWAVNDVLAFTYIYEAAS